MTCVRLRDIDPATGESENGDASIFWVFEHDEHAHNLTIHRANGIAADSEGPTLVSPEELNSFVNDLYAYAAKVWPEQEA